MNKIYYAGYLFELQKENKYSSCFFEEEMKKICNKNEDLDIGTILKKHYKNKSSEAYHPLLIDKLNQIVKNPRYMTSKIEEVKSTKLVFEIIKDENNIEYAREIFSDKIFPLIKNEDIEAKYYIEDILLTNHLGSNIYERRTNFEYDLSMTFSCKKENILELNNFFYFQASKIASPYEVNCYLEKQCKKLGLFNRRKTNKNFLKKITNLSNKNVFQHKIIEKKEEKIEREKPDKIMKAMEQIEYSLLKLDGVNHKIKEEKEKKYNELKDNYNKDLTTSPLNIDTLSKLEVEIEFAIKFGKKSENTILDILDNIINEYITNTTTNRTISDIDELVKLFLQMDYSPIIKRNAIEKFAMIYIYEIYENKEIIDINELENSYINDMLPTILICLYKMINNNEIENNNIIKLEKDPTLSYIINCIKEIKFTKNKELIKDIK